ncbi:MAG: glycerol-3-phosphate 1-O-acyltransferase PlsY [Akkermansia sp.]|nr:glycerol-3-phosphate 1-O-acyltransferase PlsY [Akkermansia sp.]
MLENVLYIVLAYLIGSVPFGYLAGKLNGIDLREHGSKNIGATNAVRVLGKKWGIPVFVCDFLKGYVPLYLVIQLLGEGKLALTQFSLESMLWVLGVMFALILGHTFTCFLHFKGGKGVATTGGCLFALSPIIGLSALLTWILMMVLTRYVSLSSMVAGLAMMTAAGYEFWWADGDLSSADVTLLSLLMIIFVLVVYKHRANIVRLCQGTEPKAFTKR